MFRTDDKAISVNGKNFKIFSALRWELMTFFIKTHLQMAMKADAVSDPLALAAEMCNKLTCMPASETVDDEEDEAITRDWDLYVL